MDIKDFEDFLKQVKPKGNPLSRIKKQTWIDLKPEKKEKKQDDIFILEPDERLKMIDIKLND